MGTVTVSNCGVSWTYSTHVPSEKDKNRTNWHFSNKSLESLLFFTRGILQSLCADLKQVLSPGNCSGNLLRSVGNRASHLLGELFGQLILLVTQEFQSLLDNFLSLS